MDIRKVNLRKAAAETTGPFEYARAGTLNDHMLNVVRGENRTLDFHVHEESDEMFLVIEGSMQLEFENGPVDLAEGDFIIVPRGTAHRPVCTGEVKVLLIEKEGTLNRRNTGGKYGLERK